MSRTMTRGVAMPGNRREIGGSLPMDNLIRMQETFCNFN